jgi:NH3-dependent NAD+ synthetase
MNQQKVIERLLAWLRATVPETSGILVPVSGGSDSALCFWLCTQVAPEKTRAVYLGTALRQKEWFEQTGRVQYSEFQAEGENPEVQRWAHFLTLSIQEERILVGSRNRTEHTLGTFSHASKVASLLPLAGLWKHQVMDLCEYVGVPREILSSSRRADPACGRPQRMADIPFEIVDTFLQSKVLNGSPISKAASEDQVAYLEDVYAAHSYKKRLPFKGPMVVERA